MKSFAIEPRLCARLPEHGKEVTDMPMHAALLSERAARVNAAVAAVILFGATVIAVCAVLIMAPADSPGSARLITRGFRLRALWALRPNRPRPGRLL